MTARRGLFAAILYLIGTLTVGTVLWIHQPLALQPGVSDLPSPVVFRLFALVVGAFLGSWLVFEIVRYNTPQSFER